MTPELVVLAVGILCLLAGIGGTLWCIHPGLVAEREAAEKARADHLAICADLLEVRGDLAERTEERDGAITALAKSIRQTEDARADAEWAHVLHAIVLAELDRHDTEHVCLPTLDGIRATNTTPMPHEDYLQVVAQPAEVVPIKRVKR